MSTWVLESFFHRRRIKTEEKSKVVAAVWGTELIQFLASLAILPLPGWFEVRNEFMLLSTLSLCNSPYFSYRPGEIHSIFHIVLVQNSLRSKEWNQFCLQAAATTFAISSVFILLLWLVLSVLCLALEDLKLKQNNSSKSRDSVPAIILRLFYCLSACVGLLWLPE